LSVPIHSIGVPLEFIEHSKRDEILNDLGITVQTITRSLVSWSLTLKELEMIQKEPTVVQLDSH
jgi:1-deoxy-D-xylulose-5-phosphate synthase